MFLQGRLLLLIKTAGQTISAAQISLIRDKTPIFTDNTHITSVDENIVIFRTCMIVIDY